MPDDRDDDSVYELACTVCPFRTTVEGDVDGVLDAIEAHQDEVGNRVADHLVEFQTVPASRDARAD